MIRLHEDGPNRWKVSAHRRVRGYIIVSQEIVNERILSRYYASSTIYTKYGYRPIGLNGVIGPHVYNTKREAALALVSYTNLFQYEK